MDIVQRVKGIYSIQIDPLDSDVFEEACDDVESRPSIHGQAAHVVYTVQCLVLDIHWGNSNGLYFWDGTIYINHLN